jgi:hypothetical protein
MIQVTFQAMDAPRRLSKNHILQSLCINQVGCCCKYLQQPPLQKMRARNGREQDGRDGRVRRKLGRVIVAIELVKNEEGRGLFYTWRARATPLGSLPSVKS